MMYTNMINMLVIIQCLLNILIHMQPYIQFAIENTETLLRRTKILRLRLSQYKKKPNK